MKSSRTKNPKKEDDIVNITVVIGRCNDKEAHDTNSSISSVTDSKEEARDNKFVRKELEVCRSDWHTNHLGSNKVER